MTDIPPGTTQADIARALAAELERIRALDLPGRERLAMIEQAHRQADKLRERVRARGVRR